VFDSRLGKACDSCGMPGKAVADEWVVDESGWLCQQPMCPICIGPCEQPVITNKMILKHGGIVKNIFLSRKWMTNGFLTEEEFIQHGNIGVMRAYRSYNVKKGAFSTYSYWWIRHEMHRFYDDNTTTVRVPSNQRNADRVAGREQRVMMRSLDYQLEPGGESMLALMEDPTIEPMSDRIDRDELVAKVFQELDKLPARTANIIRSRYLQEDWEQPTLQQIGEPHGITRERIRQLEEMGLDRVYRQLRLEGWDREL